MTTASARARGAGAAVLGVLGRAFALIVAIAILAGPAQAFLRFGELPVAIRLLWLPLFAGAIIAPRPSLFLFLGVTPLLGVMPDTYRWPPVSLGEMWLHALLVATCLRAAFVRSTRDGAEAGGGDRDSGAASAWPAVAIALGIVVTASLFVTLYPYQLAQNGLLPLGRELFAFLQGEFIVAISQRHLYASVVAWATLIEGLALLWLMTRVLRGVADVERALMAMGAGALCVAAIGLQQWWTGSALLAKWRIFDPYITRINATFSDVNAAGAYFALLLVPVWTLGRLAQGARPQAQRPETQTQMQAHAQVAPRAMGAPGAMGVAAAPAAALPVAMQRFGLSTSAWIWIWRIGAVAIAVALLCTGSRSAWAGALLAAACYSFVDCVVDGPADVPWRIRLRRPLQALAAVLLIVSAGSIYATVRDIRHNEQRSYIDTVLFTLNMRLPLDERLKGRFGFWQAGWEMWREHPWDGVGIGRYYKLMPNYLEAAGTVVVQENAHNYYLQTAAELGSSGLIALILLHLAALGSGWRAVLRSRDSRTQRLALALVCGVSAFFMTCLTGHSLLLHEGQLTFMPALALLFVLGREVSITPWITGVARAIAVLLALAVAISVPSRASAALNAVDMSGIATGLYGIERASDGTPFRWTAPQVTIYLPGAWKELHLPLRSLAPMPQTIVISLDERRIDEVTLVDHAWRTVEYALPPLKTGQQTHRLDLSISPSWTPSATDNRQLGVMLGDYGSNTVRR